MVQLHKNRSENFLAFASTRARSGSRPIKLGAVISYKLRYIVGFGLGEMAILTNPKSTIYRNLYENTGLGWSMVGCFSGTIWNASFQCVVEDRTLRTSVIIQILILHIFPYQYNGSAVFFLESSVVTGQKHFEHGSL